MARPMKSVMPGRLVLTSPTVACLYREYSWSMVLLSGRDGRFCESWAACSNLGFRVQPRLFSWVVTWCQRFQRMSMPSSLPIAWRKRVTSLASAPRASRKSTVSALI